VLTLVLPKPDRFLLSRSISYSLSGIIFLLTNIFSDIDNSAVPFVSDPSTPKERERKAENEKRWISGTVPAKH
jgi:hypothetical protein